MLSFQDFFQACVGEWHTQRTYHYLPAGELERSYTEFHASLITPAEKQTMLAPFTTGNANVAIAPATLGETSFDCPGFAISFETKSETGEEAAMTLKALFVPDRHILTAPTAQPTWPIAAEVAPTDDLVQGYYLRDEGYSEAGAIAGRFTYQPVRQTLEMTTYYRRSVAVDQMRLISPDTRLRTIVTYERPATDQPPSVIRLIGFGVEHKQPEPNCHPST
jgi:hypothetical protein